MKTSKLITSVAFATALATASISETAAADDGTAVAPRADRVQVTGPNRTMLRSGVWTLGLSYVPAVVVAVESDLPADKQLFIPVAGPWMDYATRECDDCENEGMNKALLVTDGVVQGIGALQILGSFLFIETRTTANAARSKSNKQRAGTSPGLQIAPARLASGYGVTARGYF